MSGVSTQVIDFAFDVTPIGDKNCVNLEFQAPEEFVPETLQIFLSGIHLDRGKDYAVQPDNRTFIILLEPNDPTRLNKAPFGDEKLSMNYVRL